MQDKNGRAYAKLDQLKPGSIVQVDGDFTCMQPWSEKEVRQDDEGLYIECKCNKHHLAGQLEKDGSLVGIYYVR